MLPSLPTNNSCRPVAFGRVPVRLGAIRNKLGRATKTRNVFFAGRILSPDKRKRSQCFTRGGIPAPFGRFVFHNVASVACCVLTVKEKRSKWINLFRFTL
jgi:hypothetical protein